MASVAARLLKDAPERFALAGLSMGGYVAMEVMRQAPERISRLALLDTTARPDTPETHQNRERQIALAESGRFEDIFTTLWPKLVHPDRQSDKALQEIIFGMMRETGPEAFVRQQRAICIGAWLGGLRIQLCATARPVGVVVDLGVDLGGRERGVAQ